MGSGQTDRNEKGVLVEVRWGLLSGVWERLKSKKATPALTVPQMSQTVHGQALSMFVEADTQQELPT